MPQPSFLKRALCDEQGNPSAPRTLAFYLVLAVFTLLLTGAIAGFAEKKTAADFCKSCVGYLTSASTLSLLFSQIKSGYALGEEAKATTPPTPVLTAADAVAEDDGH